MMELPDSKKTQLAPTEPDGTPPTVLASENQPTVISPYGLYDELPPYDLLYAQEPPPPPPPPPLLNEISQQPAALGVGGGGFLLTMDTISVAVSREVMICFLLLLGLLLAFWIYCHYSFRSAPSLA
jgi:hypothetical protein